MFAYLFHRAKHNLQLRGQSVNKNMSLPPDSAKNPLSTEVCLRHPCLLLSHCLESTWTSINTAHVTKWTDKASDFCKALLGGHEQLRIPGKKILQGFHCFLLNLLLDYLVLRPEESQLNKFVCVTQVPFKKNLSFLKKKKKPVSFGSYWSWITLSLKIPFEWWPSLRSCSDNFLWKTLRR